MASHWPIMFLGDAADALGLAQFKQQQPLPMASHWAITFPGNAANALGWAHCGGSCCFQWLCVGSLFFWETLPVYLDGPAAAAAASAANGCTLAHCILGRFCQCIRMGPIYALQICRHWVCISLCKNLSNE